MQAMLELLILLVSCDHDVEVWCDQYAVCGRVDTGGNRQVMDHLKDTGMLEEVSRGNDQLGKERRKGKVFQVNSQQSPIRCTMLCRAVLCCAALRCAQYIRLCCHVHWKSRHSSHDHHLSDDHV